MAPASRSCRPRPGVRADWRVASPRRGGAARRRLSGVAAARRPRVRCHRSSRGRPRAARSPRRYPRRESVTRLAVFLATVGYCGYFPFAPGTVGSAAGLVVYGLLRWSQTPLRRRRDRAHRRRSSPPACGRHAPNATSAASIPGRSSSTKCVGMLVTLAFIPVGTGRGARRLRPLPRLRRRQAVSGAPLRAAARRPRHDGRRRDGGRLRQPVAAPADGGLCPPGYHDGWRERRCAPLRRPKSSPSAASCSAPRASTPTRCTSPSGCGARHRAAGEDRRRRQRRDGRRASPARARARRPGGAHRRPRARPTTT